MRTIIVKEIRENLRWALLLMLGMAGVLACAVYADASTTGLVLVGQATSKTTAIAFPVAGLALGLLVVLQDHRRGRWGFVMHRPVPQTAIFFAKVVAGVLLYGVVGGLPLAITVAWVATPGHVAGPFDWQMVSPPLADLIGGLMWIATGLLIGAREARWLGSRLMPVGFGLIVAAYAWVFPFHLWQAVLILTCGMAVLLAAAWAAFVAGDDYERQPLVARGLQVIAVGTGLAMAVGLVLNLAAAGIQWGHPTADWSHQQYRITRRGLIVVTNYARDGSFKETDLAGHTPPDWEQGDNETMSAAELSLVGCPTDASSWQRRWQSNALHSADAYAYPIGGPGSHWFYRPRSRTIEGFDVKTGQFNGSTGPKGFNPYWIAPEPFPQQHYEWSAAPRLTLSSPSGVYWLKFDQGPDPVYVASSGDPVVGSPAVFNGGADVISGDFLAVPTRTGIQIIDHDRLVCRLPLDRADPPYTRVSVGQASNGQFVLHYKTDRGVSDRAARDRVVVADSGGHIVSRTDLPILKPISYSNPWYTESLEVVSIPPFLMAIIRVFGTNQVTSLDVLVVFAAGLGSAATTILLTNRYGLNRRGRIAWITFAAVSGIPGVLALLAMRPTPSRIDCRDCGRRRLVTRATCEHCGARFPAPAAEGIEVLEAA